MADNISIKDGTGATVVVISQDTGGGVQLPGHHIADPVTPSQKLLIDSGGRPTVNVNGTVAVSAASLPLPTGAATSAAQTAAQTSLTSIDGKTPALGQALAASSSPVVLTAAQITTLTPPAAITGFALDATVGTTNTEIGIVTETAPATDTASSGLNGRLQRIAQRITSLITALGSPFQAGGSIGNTSFASTVADGANVVEGAVADAVVAAGATGTISAKLRRISTDIGSLVTGTVLAAGSALIGAVGAILRTDAMLNGTTSLTPKFAFATLSATGSVVAAVTSKKIRVLRYSMMADAACTVYFRTIATATQISGTKYIAATGGAGGTFSPVGQFETISGEALGLFITGAANVSVDVVYVEV